MRMSYLKSGILFIGCLVFLLSCQKQGVNPPDIEFLSPKQSQTVFLDDIMLVEIDIRDDIEVDSYEISLTSELGFEFFRDKKDVNMPFHRLSYGFEMTTAVNQIFNITVIAKDNDGNESERSIMVTIDK